MSLLPIENDKDSFLLKQEIFELEQELKSYLKEKEDFEYVLRQHLMDKIIEERELSDIYRQLQKDKKKKRQAQKRKGKNYIEPNGLVKSKEGCKVNEPEGELIDVDAQQEKKKLYRECMMLVHPDKFSTVEDNESMAGELTAQLILLYKSGTLQELKDFKNHIKGGNITLIDTDNSITTADKNAHLISQKDKLKEEIKELLASEIYKLSKEYKNPMDYVLILQEFYDDRLTKLRKRTRKVRK